jgi:hypothetical protein
MSAIDEREPVLPIVIRHNLNPNEFMWLWAKYVQKPNLTKHCTACLVSCPVATSSGKKSPYSQRFSKASNPQLASAHRIVMDECEPGSFEAVYLCGVSSKGYRSKRNYTHNFHAAIVPIPGANDHFVFENLDIRIENGRFTRIPTEAELTAPYATLSRQYTTCRIFRWAACILPILISGDQNERNGLLISPAA